MQKVLTLLIGVLAAGTCGTARAWELSEETDRLTERKVSALVKEAGTATIEPERRDIERGVFVALVLRCERGKLAAVVQAPKKLMASHRNRVDYRVDDDRPVSTTRWLGSDDKTSIGIWDDKAARSFTKSLIGKRTLVFRNTAAVFGTTEAYFNVENLSEAIKQLPAACRI